MQIGIDASRAFVENRTGIEEYSFQVIKNLRDKLEGHQVVLYLRTTNYEFFTNIRMYEKDWYLPYNWKIKVIKFPYLWTQLGLSLEMLFQPVDVLFIPAHTVPPIHPKNTIVTIHGLEYEFCKSAYSFWERIYMRLVIKNSCRWAKKIIAVSENTKKDLVKLYRVPEEKISVIYEGTDLNQNAKIKNQNDNEKLKKDKYLLFVGRLEERKNIGGIIKAFEILKEKYKIPHKLILVGKPGYGFDRIMNYESGIKHWNEIVFKGFVSGEEKYELLKNADVFLLPSFYEGFGLPILEAQAVGCPVVTSNISSMPEITCHSERSEAESRNPCLAGRRVIRSFDYAISRRNCSAQDDKTSALLVNPKSPKEIAEAAYKLISDEKLRNDIINRGFENVKRFSWEECVERISKLIG